MRITETIDQTEAIKFCFIKSQPEATSFKSKGKLGLLGGAVSSVFHPYHGDIFIDEVGDLKVREKQGFIASVDFDEVPNPQNFNLQLPDGRGHSRYEKGEYRVLVRESQNYKLSSAYANCFARHSAEDKKRM